MTEDIHYLMRIRLIIKANGSGDMGYLGYGGADSKFYIVNQLNDDMIISTNNTERMRITSGGIVSINGGLTTYHQVAIKSNSTNTYGGLAVYPTSGDRFINIQHTGAQGFIEVDYAGSSGFSDLGFRTGGSERMRITSGGSVGIGTTSPQSFTRLEVAGTAGAQTDAAQQVIITAPTTTVAHGAGLRFNAASGAKEAVGIVGVVNEASGNLGAMTFHTYGGGGNIPERMRISSVGNVFINSTSNQLPDNATPQLGILGATGTDAVSIKHLANGNNTFNLWQTGATAHNAIVFYKGDTQSSRGNINVTTSGTTYNSVSDYRLKENVVPVENGIDRLMQLKPSKFNWIETGNEAEGFIAHELQEIFPDAVTGEKDETYESTGNIKPQSVDYGRITPLLVKALQEQQTLIESLKSRIEILEQ